MLFNTNLENADDLKILRLALIAELDAVNFYERMREIATGDDVKEILNHLIDDENEHIVLLLSVLEGLDASLRSNFENFDSE